jgi:Ca2+-binding RTX toxin-like protein
MNETRNGYRRRWNHSMLPLLRLVTLFAASLPTAVLAAEIIGTPGPDVLEGTQDADLINGRGGADVMMGLAGNDTYIVAQTDDEVLEAVGDGTDTVKATVSYSLPINVENLMLTGSAAINGTGNGLDNRLIGNTGDNILSGRAGADRMSGGGGNDTYSVDSSGDLVIETLGSGTDTVRSAVTHTLRANVENLVLTGTSAVNGAGNGLANTMRGNAANNVLRGMEGDDELDGFGGSDRLAGGPGNDHLFGGAGPDGFEFDAPLDAQTNMDFVEDFSPALDKIRLIGAVFQGLTTAGALPATAFRLGTAAADASDRILYDPATGNMRYDADGTGPTPAVRFGRLVSAPAVTNAAFVVIDPVVTPVDYSSQIQSIFDARCISCHIGGGAPQQLRLDAANSYSLLVNVASHEVPSLLRVEPGNPDDSYLVQKVEGTAAVGSRMPLNSTPLTEEQIALIRRWISEGAND